MGKINKILMCLFLISSNHALQAADATWIGTASGNLNIEIAALFALGSLAGLVFGKLMERKISGTRVQQIFAIFAFLVALSLIYKAL